MNFKIIFPLLLVGLFLSSTISAQEEWDLAKCLVTAQGNNIEIKQGTYGIRRAHTTLKQDKNQRYPTLNLSTGGGYQFGRTIDPTTNNFDNNNIGYNDFSLSAGLTIFNGGRLHNQLKRDRVNLQIAQLDAQTTERDIALEVTRVYLNVLLVEEQLGNAVAQLEQIKRQLDQTQKMIKAGVLPQQDEWDMLTQVSEREQLVADTRQLVELGYLDLKLVMGIDATTPMRVKKQSFAASTNQALGDFNGVYAKAQSVQPQIKADQLRLKSAEKGIDIAKAGFLPVISLYGSLNSNFSTAGKSVSGFRDVWIPQNALVDGEPTQFFFENTVPMLEDATYQNQLDENFGQNIGLEVSIPIFNQRRTVSAIEIAELNVLETQSQVQLNSQRLKMDIQRAVSNAKAAQIGLRLATQQFEVAEKSHQATQRSFDLGASDTYQLLWSKSQRDAAEIALTKARYEYLFNIKILDYYQGKPLSE